MSLRSFKDRLIGRLLTRYPSLVRRWTRGLVASGDARSESLGDPWATLAKPLAECRVAIVTTAGVHLRSQESFDMETANGDPTFREIPDDTPAGELIITHIYYDHRDADRDINVVFPLDRLSELAAEGRIAGRAPLHLGFMGHIDGPLADRLIQETAPEAARRLSETGADCAVLTPA